MNTKGNQRTKETENRIKRAYLELVKEKGVKAVSVSEICRKAQIHRTTFYVHYLDTEDLLQKMTDDMYRQLQEIFQAEEYGVWNGGFLRLFEEVQKEQEFFRVYVNSIGEIHMEYALLPEALQKNLDRVVNPEAIKSKETQEYLRMFFCAGLSAIMMKWIKEGCKKSPRYMADILVEEYRGGRRADG